ncbi:hypothetical protein Dda_7374 [Drechslerella dactyloides]|uniref:Uncharacterized protein n=1 Tax=Drechslerella dactyloides TaxID=74499 RepID=A0AAD6NGQ0_DREDA|nr:hypothetical protein Dda_7374 [Drechslerella dactyloides]
MSLTSFLNKIEQKALGGSSQPAPPNPQYGYPPAQAPPPNNHYNNPPAAGPQYGNPPPMNAYYGNQPQHAPAQSGYHGNPAPQSAPAAPTATRTFNLTSSLSGSTVTVTDASTEQTVWVLCYPPTSAYSNKTGKPNSGVDRELHDGGKDGAFLGGIKLSETTGKASIRVGDNEQKLKNQSMGSRSGFVAPDGRDCEWRPGGEKGAYRLLDSSGRELASFEPYGGMTSSKVGQMEVQTGPGEGFVKMAFLSLNALLERKAEEKIGKEVLKAVIGIST